MASEWSLPKHSNGKNSGTCPAIPGAGLRTYGDENKIDEVAARNPRPCGDYEPPAGAPSEYALLDATAPALRGNPQPETPPRRDHRLQREREQPAADQDPPHRTGRICHPDDRPRLTQCPILKRALSLSSVHFRPPVTNIGTVR